jgi:hypothetical protein
MFTASTQETIFSLRVLYLSSFIDAEGHHSNLFLLSALHIALLCVVAAAAAKKGDATAETQSSLAARYNSLSDHA